MPTVLADTFTVNVDGSDPNDPIATANGDCDIDTSNGTPDECTLRAAIQVANANGNGATTIDTINFAIPKVTLDASLNQITERVVIDGSTQTPRTEIDGNGRDCFEARGNGYAPGGGPAILPQANNSRFVSLVIHNCSFDAINLIGHGFVVYDSYLGVLPDGVTASPNGGDGISITASLADGGIPPLGSLPLPGEFSDLAAAVTFLATALPGIAPNGIVSNVISGNDDSGIDIFGEYAAGNIIFDNRIGTDAAALLPVPNGRSAGHGVSIRNDAYANIIGIDNVIAGNNDFMGNGNPNSTGVLIDTGRVVFPNFILGNFIGTSLQSAFLNPALGNGEAGVRVISAGPASTGAGDPIDNPLGLSVVIGPGNIVGFNGSEDGVPDPIPSNAFSGGTAAVSFLSGGILVTNANSEGLRVFGNLIGVSEDAVGFLDIGNNGDGINLVGTHHDIGGENFIEGNIIGGNDRHGITVRSSNSHSIRIHGNNIGTLPLTDVDAGNDGNGIWIYQAGGISIGVEPIDGESPDEINRIAFNDRHGIQIEPTGSGTSAWSIPIRQNPIFGVPSGFLGIDLSDTANGRDSNAASNRDSNARTRTNWRQNTVSMSNPGYSGGTTSVDYALQSAANGSYRVEFFASADDGLGGEIFLDEITISTDAAGQASGTFSTSAGDTRGLRLTATVTDLAPTDPGAGEPNPPGSTMPGPANNTSEFSEPVAIPDTIAFTAATLLVNEADGSADLTLRREGTGSGAVTVDLSITDLTTDLADRGAPTPGTVNWTDGDTADKLVSVPIIDDVIFEGNEDFELSFTVTSGAAIAASPQTATVTIVDNDSQPSFDLTASGAAEGGNLVFTVTRNGGSQQNTSVDYQITAAASTEAADFQAVDPLSGTLTFTPTDSALTIEVLAVDDAIYEPAEALEGQLSNPVGGTIGTGTASAEIAASDSAPVIDIADASTTESDADQALVFQLTKTGATELPATVDYQFSDGTATTPEDYVGGPDPLSGSVTLAPGATTENITITVVGDDVFEPTPAEIFSVTLSGPVDASLGMGSATGSITDDDSAPTNGSLQFDMATYTVAENGGMATISVTRVGGTDGTVSVDFATADGTATAGSDYAANSGTLSWPDGDATPQSFDVMITDDAADEPDETVNLSLSNPTGGASIGSPDLGILTIEDDEIPGIKTFTGPSATGSGSVQVTFTGGGTSCGFTASTALVSPPAPLPAGGYEFPHGVLASDITGCTPGATLDFTVTYPQTLPVGSEFWKYGPRPMDPVPSWYPFPATLTGDTVTFSITDGGLGDDDLLANGSIVDPAGPAFIPGPVGNQPAIAVPATGSWARLLLVLLMLMVGVLMLRRTV
jgi:CSLREA domain-containing protein